MANKDLQELLEGYKNEKAQALWEESQAVFTGESATAHAELGQKIVQLGPLGMLWVWNKIVATGNIEMASNAHRVLVTDLLTALHSMA